MSYSKYYKVSVFVVFLVSLVSCDRSASVGGSENDHDEANIKISKETTVGSVSEAENIHSSHDCDHPHEHAAGNLDQHGKIPEKLLNESRLADALLSMMVDGSDKKTRREILYHWIARKRKLPDYISIVEDGYAIMESGETILVLPHISDAEKYDDGWIVAGSRSDLKNVSSQLRSDYIIKDDKVEAGYNQLYYVRKNGDVEQLSSQREHVQFISKSTNRDWIAYTRKIIDNIGRVSNNDELVVLNIKDGRRLVAGSFFEFNEISVPHFFSVYPVSFHSNKLNVIINYGETGGNEQNVELTLDIN